MMLAILCAGSLAAQWSGVVDGTVVNSVTRAGIPGVEIRIFTRQGNFQVTQSDGSGRFHFEDLEPGEYRFTLTREGFDQPAERPGGERVVPVTGPQLIRVALEMLPLSTLTGRVLDADGEPMAGVTVELLGLSDGTMRRRESSGADGAFVVGELLPGRYQLRANPFAENDPEADYMPPDEVANTAPAGDVEAASTVPLITYYPSVTVPQQAQPLQIGGLVNEGPYEIRLRTAQAFPVSGTVYDPQGNPAAGVRLRWMHRSLATNFNTYLGGTEFFVPMTTLELEGPSAISASDGTFFFESVPESDWTLEGRWLPDPDAAGQTEQRGTAGLRIPRTGLDRVNLQLNDTFDFVGEVIAEDAPNGRLFGSLFLVSETSRFPLVGSSDPPGGRLPSDFPNAPAADKEAEGHGPLYFVGATPGPYRVLPMQHPLPGTYVAEVLYGGRDVLGQTIQLTANPPPLQVILEKGAGSLDVHLKGREAGDPDVSLVLLPVDANAAELPRSRQCSGADACPLANLSPGEYWVGAFDRTDRRMLLRPEFRPDLTRLMTRATVRRDGSTVLELDVKRWPE